MPVRPAPGTSLSRPAQNNVLLGPGMHRAAVRAGKLLRFYFGRLPVLVVDRPAGVGQFRCRGTANEQAFDICAVFRFGASRAFEEESCSHIKVDKRSALWRYRKVTSAFLLDLRWLSE